MNVNTMARIPLAAILVIAPIAASADGPAQGSSRSAQMTITAMVVRSSSATLGKRDAKFFALVVPGQDGAPVRYAIKDSHGERFLAGSDAVDRALTAAQRDGEREIVLTTLF